MKIKWLGHSSFLITSESGTRVITDPYTTGGGINYGEIDEAAEVVLISHDHPDHNNAAAVRGGFRMIKGVGANEAKGIAFKGIASYHDDAGGAERGPNTIFCFTVDGVRLCHLGDLGHRLTEEQAKEIGGVDILFIPVGGFFTIDAKTAAEVSSRLNPRLIIPMHFKTKACGYPIARVDDFIRGMPGVVESDSSEVEFSKETLPLEIEVLVLEHAL